MRFRFFPEPDPFILPFILLLLAFLFDPVGFVDIVVLACTIGSFMSNVYYITFDDQINTY